MLVILPYSELSKSSGSASRNVIEPADLVSLSYSRDFVVTLC